ncbi:MAG: hypothetical protein JNK69_07700 [Saprospiraceae bacterium]|nr:hypothetical protein [Saprospiraceae bacterium]MCC6843759.1 hypothetical protein [Saprospiraceae bacterium]HRG32547.1 hypothetical protein [Saprospiraceae bacterium]
MLRITSWYISGAHRGVLDVFVACARTQNMTESGLRISLFCSASSGL